MAVPPRVLRARRRSASDPTTPRSRGLDAARCVGRATITLALGQVPEVADADPPHRPSGCVAQAWSVAELLRALAWDLA